MVKKKINNTQSWFFRKNNKTDKRLAGMTKKKGDKAQWLESGMKKELNCSEKQSGSFSEG